MHAAASILRPVKLEASKYQISDNVMWVVTTMLLINALKVTSHLFQACLNRNVFVLWKSITIHFLLSVQVKLNVSIEN